MHLAPPPIADAASAPGLRRTCLDDRHTFGSQLAQNNVSLYKIATLMGNRPEICRRYPAALVPEAMAGEVEILSLPSPLLRAE